MRVALVSRRGWGERRVRGYKLEIAFLLVGRTSGGGCGRWWLWRVRGWIILGCSRGGLRRSASGTRAAAAVGAAAFFFFLGRVRQVAFLGGSWVARAWDRVQEGVSTRVPAGDGGGGVGGDA
jgi:hypothetical protein